MALTISRRMEGKVEILGLAGRLILGEETSGLRLQMVSVFERQSDLLVDLSELTYIDSAGLSELVGAPGVGWIPGAEHEAVASACR